VEIFISIIHQSTTLIRKQLQCCFICFTGPFACIKQSSLPLVINTNHLRIINTQSRLVVIFFNFNYFITAIHQNGMLICNGTKYSISLLVTLSILALLPNERMFILRERDDVTFVLTESFHDAYYNVIAKRFCLLVCQNFQFALAGAIS